MTTKRPDLSAYFRSRIDWHVRGLMSGHQARLPNAVKTIDGDVTDHRIVVTMVDGTVWEWAGGRYATRKVAGCYAPLMPKVKVPAHA